MDAGVDIRPANPEARQLAIAELDRLDSSRDFHASDRLRRLLRYLVEQTLSGNERKLNQRQLAEDVFGRSNNFDPEHDAIVRVEVCKLRQSLTTYYDRVAVDSPVRIELPKGSYVPRFCWQQDRPVTARKKRNRAPAIAVVPFRANGEDATGARLAAGLTDELSATLACIPYLRMISMWPSGEASDISADIGKMQDRHGLRFLLEGSVQCGGSRARVFVRLHDTMRQEEVWGDRFDYEIGDDEVLDSQQRLSFVLSGHLADVYVGAINRVLMQEIRSDNDSMGEAHRAILQFSNYFNSHSDSAYMAARYALEAAYGLEPDNPLVIALTADIRRTGYSLGFTDEADPIAKVRQMSRQATGLAPRSPACRLSLCYALLQARDKTALLETVKPLLDDSTLTPGYRGDAALALSLAGEWEAGCDILRSLLHPLGTVPHAFYYPLVIERYRSEDYAGAWELTHKFPPSALFWQPMLKTAILGQLGNKDDAGHYAREVLAARPKFTSLGRRFLSCFLMENSLVEHLIEGLAKGGLVTR